VGPVNAWKLGNLDNGFEIRINNAATVSMRFTSRGNHKMHSSHCVAAVPAFQQLGSSVQFSAIKIRGAAVEQTLTGRQVKPSAILLTFITTSSDP
jgi:hypothetical protein